MGGPVGNLGKVGNCGTIKGRWSVLCEDAFVGIKGRFELLFKGKGKCTVEKGRFCSLCEGKGWCCSLFKEDGMVGR